MKQLFRAVSIIALALPFFACASLEPTQPVGVSRAAAQAPQSNAKINWTSTIDLAKYFPNPEMSKTHVLKAHSGRFNNWDLRPMLDDGQYNIFYGHSSNPGNQLAKDIYIIGPNFIALVMNVLDDGALIHFLPPYPALDRFLNLLELPISTSTFGGGAVHKAADGTITPLPHTPAPVTISREGDLVKLQWGDETRHEILYIGDVPIEGTHLTAPGLRRYKALYDNHNVDTWFEWSPR